MLVTFAHEIGQNHLLKACHDSNRIHRMNAGRYVFGNLGYLPFTFDGSTNLLVAVQSYVITFVVASN